MPGKVVCVPVPVIEKDTKLLRMCSTQPSLYHLPQETIYDSHPHRLNTCLICMNPGAEPENLLASKKPGEMGIYYVVYEKKNGNNGCESPQLL